jgi:hypothetical protein
VDEALWPRRRPPAGRKGFARHGMRAGSEPDRHQRRRKALQTRLFSIRSRGDLRSSWPGQLSCGGQRLRPASCGDSRAGVLGMKHAGGRLRVAGKHNMLIWRAFTGATGLESTTSGVTGGRSSGVRPALLANASRLPSSVPSPLIPCTRPRVSQNGSDPAGCDVWGYRPRGSERFRLDQIAGEEFPAVDSTAVWSVFLAS